MNEKLAQNGINIDQEEFEKLGNQTQKLIDEYKEGMEKMQKELEKKGHEF